MNKNIKNIVVIVCFISILSGLMLTNIIKSDAEFSLSERRKLASLPEISLNKLFSGDLFEDLEKYYLDQFAIRDAFRGLKALGSYYLLGKKDNNGIYVIDGNINKIEYPLNEKSVINAANKLNEVYEKYLHNMKVYYSVIPDKNYFLASENGYPEMDYGRMLEIIKQQVENIDFIDIFSTLTVEDYYKTDLHWRQEATLNAANKLLEEMETGTAIEKGQYNEKSLYPFYGSFSGQYSLKTAPDKLVYLTNSMLEKAKAYDYEAKAYSSIYLPERFNGPDPYDVYISGAKALISLTNPESASKKELILFRDSFGSSIAPLLLSGYSKITLVDLRYISTDLLGKYLDFSKDQDVLFLYNTMILNNSYMLK